MKDNNLLANQMRIFFLPFFIGQTLRNYYKCKYKMKANVTSYIIYPKSLLLCINLLCATVSLER